MKSKRSAQSRECQRQRNNFMQTLLEPVGWSVPMQGIFMVLIQILNHSQELLQHSWLNCFCAIKMEWACTASLFSCYIILITFYVIRGYSCTKYECQQCRQHIHLPFSGAFGNLGIQVWLWVCIDVAFSSILIWRGPQTPHCYAAAHLMKNTSCHELGHVGLVDWLFLAKLIELDV